MKEIKDLDHNTLSKEKCIVITVPLDEHMVTFKLTFTKKKDEKAIIMQIETLMN